MNKDDFKLKSEELRIIAEHLKSSKPLHDSGKRRYKKNYHEDGGYSVSVSDPVLKMYIGEIHPESFVDMAIEILNGE